MGVDPDFFESDDWSEMRRMSDNILAQSLDLMLSRSPERVLTAVTAFCNTLVWRTDLEVRDAACQGDLQALRYDFETLRSTGHWNVGRPDYGRPDPATLGAPGYNFDPSTNPSKHSNPDDHLHIVAQMPGYGCPSTARLLSSGQVYHASRWRSRCTPQGRHLQVRE